MSEPSLATIRSAKAGDRDAIAEIVTEQQRYVYSIAMSLMHDSAEAADLTQDAFIRLLRAIGTYRGETKFTTWLYRLVVNLGLDRLRRLGRTPVRLDYDPNFDVPSDDPELDAPLVLERAEQAQVVRAAVAQLPEGQRLALTLHYFEELRYEDIADVMGISINTVKSHIRRGKERLAAMLGSSRPEGSAARRVTC